MSMDQTEWARRVAAIGKMAGWDTVKSELSWLGPRIAARGPSWAAFDTMEDGEPDPAAIAAIRQLCADWLAAEGVVAVRVCHCPRCGGKIEVTP